MLSWRRDWVAIVLLLALLIAVDVALSSFWTCADVGQQGSQPREHQETEEGCSGFKGPLIVGAGTAALWSVKILRNEGAAVIAAFTIVLVISTTLLWISTERAAKAAEKAASHIPTVERAWVFAGPDAKSTRNEPGLFEVKLWIKNYGKTPGFVKVIWARFSKDAPYDPVPKYEGAEKIQTELVLGTQEGFLWPKPFGTAFDERYFYGYIRYADIFKANQVTRFCVRLVPEEGRFEMAGSPAWNDHYTE